VQFESDLHCVRCYAIRTCVLAAEARTGTQPAIESSRPIFYRTLQSEVRKTALLCLSSIHPSVPMGLFVMSRFDGLGNGRLLGGLKELVKRDRVIEADLLAHLGEVEARRLYLEQGCSSMFDYCVKELRFSESVAYKRIGVARVSRKFPSVVESIARGELHLSGASLIAPHLSEETVAGWLEDVQHKKSREIRQLVADRFPREAVRSSVRRVGSVSRSAGLEGVVPFSGAVARESTSESTGSVPARSAKQPMQLERSKLSMSVDPDTRPPAATTLSPPSKTEAKASTEALGAQRYSVRFTADEKVHAELQELRFLLRHSVPDGDVGKILARAIGVLLKQVRNTKIGECASPRPRQSAPSLKAESLGKKPTRHIPVAIRRVVWARDKGRCTFESKDGRSCESREAIEFHHRVPWARCCEHTVENIALRCRAHNQYEADLDLGTEHMIRFRRKTPAEKSRNESEPRADADSRADSGLNHQLDSNPLGSRRLCAERHSYATHSSVVEESFALD